MKGLRKLAVAAAITTSTMLAGVANASVFSTGAPASYVGSNNSALWVQANSFSSASASNIFGATVYMVSQSTGQPDLASWDGSFEYFLYANSGNAPGALLASGNAANLTTTNTGISAGALGNIWAFSFDFQSTLGIQGGTKYWLGVHSANDYAVRDPLSWADIASPAQASSAAESFHNTGSWTPYSLAHAFSIEGTAARDVPEPGSMPLLGLGLVGLAMLRKRRSA